MSEWVDWLIDWLTILLLYRAIPKNIIKTIIKRMLPNSDHLVHGIASSAKTVGFDSFCNCVLTAIYNLAAYVCAYKRQSYDIQNQDRYKRTCHREA